MLREYAPSLSNRGHILEEQEVANTKGGIDRFMSLFCYEEDIRDYIKDNGKIAGYDGVIYLAKEHILDVDGESYDEARDAVVDLLALLDDLSCPYKIYFSGRGFHISLPPDVFKWEPGKMLHKQVKDSLDAKGIFKFADPAVTDKTRLIRVNNSINSKSKKWKVLLFDEGKYNSELETWTESDVKDIASKPSAYVYGFKKEYPAVFDALPAKKRKLVLKAKKSLIARKADPTNYPCIQTMLQGGSYGSRHQYALRVASHFRWRVDEPVLQLIMEDWRQRVTTEDNPFEKHEIQSIINSSYTGHNGTGYNYGCSDKYKDMHCKESCRLYHTKVNTQAMSFADMQASAMQFYSNGHKPLQLGSLYNTTFPIYGGELVILQAPPKSMKTMLIHNWIIAFEKPTYFLEMEMSPRQMFIRHRQIKEGITYEKAESDATAGVGIDYDVSWLTFDYKSCYPFELEKKILMLPDKPEIVVIDHIGLMQSKNKDINGKMEEVMEALKNLAIRHSIIVIGISEVTKESMNKRTGTPAIMAGRGSARIAYTANKLLSLKPFKSKGDIGVLELECIANREREHLNVRLKPDNCKLTQTWDEE